jgi:hypothetical protein
MRRCRLFAICAGLAAICVSFMLGVVSASCQEPGKPANSGAPAAPSQQQPAESSTWQLSRTPNPAGGPDSISITKITDTTRSDQDVAGLSLRCGEGATNEVLVVLGKPLPLQTHPKVTVVAGATTTDFTASVVKPGALVLLPEKASALLETAWQSVPELAVIIATKEGLLRGTVPLGDISAALRTLQSNCSKAVRGR